MWIHLPTNLCVSDSFSVDSIVIRELMCIGCRKKTLTCMWRPDMAVLGSCSDSRPILLMRRRVIQTITATKPVSVREDGWEPGRKDMRKRPGRNSGHQQCTDTSPRWISRKLKLNFLRWKWDSNPGSERPQKPDAECLTEWVTMGLLWRSVTDPSHLWVMPEMFELVWAWLECYLLRSLCIQTTGPTMCMIILFLHVTRRKMYPEV